MKRRVPPATQTSQSQRSERPRRFWPGATTPFVAMLFVAIGSWSLGACMGFWLSRWRDRQAAGDGAAKPLTSNNLSFEEYAVEMLGSTKPLPVSVVTSYARGSKDAMALPAGTVIGVQSNWRERWFWVFDRSQVFIIDSSEMSSDFPGTLDRYSKMLEGEELFREWYRPHNQRLYALIG